MKIFKKPKLELLDDEIQFINDYVNDPVNKRKKTKLTEVFQNRFGKKHDYKTLIRVYNSKKVLLSKIRKTRKDIAGNYYTRNRLAINIKRKYQYKIKKKYSQLSSFCKNSRFFGPSIRIKFGKQFIKPSVLQITKRLFLKEKIRNTRFTIRKAVAINKVNLRF